jgi:hypothetical protein
MLALFAMLWFFTHWRGTGVYLFWAAILACRFFLGGYYRGGLVKPFQYKRPMNADAPPSLMALKLRVYQPVLDSDEDRFRNDERELHQRDRAHYLAFQAAGLTVVLPMFSIASLRIVRPQLFPVAMSPDEMYYGLALMSVILFLTLPQCVLLWTEPDMEEAS